MDGVRWLDEQEAAAWRGLQNMQTRLNAVLARELAIDSDLSYPDYMVLVALTDQPDGRLRAFELGRILGWEKSRVSHHVSRMVARGLVTRVRCPSDQRGSFVVVSEQGEAAIRAAAGGHVAAVRRYVIDRLTPAQLDALATISAEVLAALDETGGDAHDETGGAALDETGGLEVLGSVDAHAPGDRGAGSGNGARPRGDGVGAGRTGR